MDKAMLAIRGIRPFMLLLGLLSLLQAGAVIAQALFLARAVTLLFHGRPLAEAIEPLLLFAASFIARHTFVWLAKLFSGRFAEEKSEQVRMELLKRVFERGPGYVSSIGSGRLVTLALDGVTRFRTYLELFAPRMMDMVFITASILLMIYFLDLTSGLILTFTMPVLIGFFILLGFAARKTANKQWRSYQVLAHHFTDALRGLETLRFLGRSRSYAQSVENVSERYHASTMRTLRVAFLSSFALDFFSTLSVAFAAVGLGLRLINGSVGLEAALAVLLLAPEYFTPVRMLGTDYHASLDGKEAFHSIRTMTADDEEPSRDEETKPAPAKRGPSSQSHASKVQFDSIQKIELQHIYVSGETEHHARLSDLTVSATNNVKKIGIAGMSGAGKTTLLNLLSGFQEPDGGEIIVNGHLLTKENISHWQKQLAFIPQHPSLISGTIADNIRLYEPETSDEKIAQALTDVGLDGLISQFPKGIHERIGEGSRTLSGGQAHRVALARALVGNRSMLLLDEPTAHLDIETEFELKRTMLPLFEHKFVFLATHRLHWMKDMDIIWVLHDGKVVETGTYTDLINKHGFFTALLQASRSAE